MDNPKVKQDQNSEFTNKNAQPTDTHSLFNNTTSVDTSDIQPSTEEYISDGVKEPQINQKGESSKIETLH